MGLSDFFSSGGSDQFSQSFTGLRGLGGNDQYAETMANLINPSIRKGADFGFNMLQNPSGLLDSNGLYSQQSNMFPSIVNMIAGKMSGAAGARGQLSPENIGSVAGSSATAAAPYLLPLIGQNISDIRNAGANLFGNMLNTGAGALGSENTSTGTTRGPQMGWMMADKFFEMMKNIGSAWGSPGAGAAGGMM